MRQPARQSRRLNVENLLATAVPPGRPPPVRRASPRPCGRTDGRRPRASSRRPWYGRPRRCGGTSSCGSGRCAAAGSRRRPRRAAHRARNAPTRPAPRRSRPPAHGRRRPDRSTTRRNRPSSRGRPRACAPTVVRPTAARSRFCPRGFGRRRKIENHLGAGRSRLRRWRGRNPQILAYLHRAPRTADVEQQVGTERHALPAQLDLDRRAPLTRSEPARLVELGVVGNMTLGHDTQYFARGRHDSAVVEHVVHRDGRPTTNAVFSSAVRRSSSARVCSAAASSAGCRKRSPQV